MIVYNEEEGSLDVSYDLVIMIVGKENVGKASLITRYGENKFRDKNASRLIKNYITTTTGDEKIRVRFIEKPTGYIYDDNYDLDFDYDGIIFLYDVTQEETANFIPQSIKHFRKLKGKSFPMLLLGNKIDKVTEESNEKVRDFGLNLARKNGIQFLEISCKSGKNTDNAANLLIKAALMKQQELKDKRIEETKLVINEDKQDIQDKDGCCGFFCK